MKLNTAKQKLKTILKDNMNRRSVISKKWIIKWTRLHAFSTSDRLFSKRLENSWKTYNLEILFDASGSMAHWHWTGSRSAFYNWIQVIQNLVKLFNWVIDINLTFFNLKEWTMTTKEILKLDVEPFIDTNTCFDFMWVNNLTVDSNNHIVESKWRWELSWAEWNYEITSIQNAYLRLQKKKWEKLLIVVWDWQMRCDSFDTQELIDWNYYIAWQSLKKFNPYTANEICKHIMKNSVHLFWIWIWTKLRYIPNNIQISKWEEVYEKVFTFLKESLK